LVGTLHLTKRSMLLRGLRGKSFPRVKASTSFGRGARRCRALWLPIPPLSLHRLTGSGRPCGGERSGLPQAFSEHLPAFAGGVSRSPQERDCSD
jgi:hypothetical protein